MKKLFILMVLISLTLLASGDGLAAVHNVNGDFFNPFLDDYDFFSQTRQTLGSFENWYLPEKKKAPEAIVGGAFFDNFNLINAEYYENDQTFADLTYNSDNYKPDLLKGSYLFNNNFFVGLDYIDLDYAYQTFIAPGYRFNFPADAGYLAASLDYYALSNYSDFEHGILDYEINGCYYSGRSRFYGQVIVFNEELTNYHRFYHVGGAYRWNNNWVWGADLEINADYYTNFGLGGTVTYDKFGTDFKLLIHTDANNRYANYDTLYLNVLYSITDKLRAGLEIYQSYYPKYDFNLDPFLVIKAKYSFNTQNTVILMHQFKNGSSQAETYLAWDLKLK